MSVRPFAGLGALAAILYATAAGAAPHAASTGTPGKALDGGSPVVVVQTKSRGAKSGDAAAR